MVNELLKGHVSPETAYVVDDYPYGFTLRCKIRYWLEHHPKHGTRMVSQTTNPKRPGEVWNKPKASTYCKIAGAMYLDEKGYVQWSGLDFYGDAAECNKWLDQYAPALPEEILAKVHAWIIMKTRYETLRAAQGPRGVL